MQQYIWKLGEILLSTTEIFESTSKTIEIETSHVLDAVAPPFYSLSARSLATDLMLPNLHD